VTPEAERVYAAMLLRRCPGAMARDRAGAAVPLDTARWLGGASEIDLRVLRRAVAPVLDVGCGPGRHVRALAALGVPALGLDASRAAVRLARARGAEVVHGSVFGDVPDPGGWHTALLLDGSIGIGGDPAVLLARIAAMLAPGGRILCECEAPGAGLQTGPVRLEHAHDASEWFPWARVGHDALAGVAGAAGLATRDRWEDDGRWFGHLEAP
jgi:SAM-dependent methyltransferase